MGGKWNFRWEMEMGARVCVWGDEGKVGLKEIPSRGG